MHLWYRQNQRSGPWAVTNGFRVGLRLPASGRLLPLRFRPGGVDG